MRPPDSWAKARVTLVIALACLSVWLLAGAAGVHDRLVMQGSFVAAEVGGDPGDGRVPFWLAPLTSAFIHFNFIHLAFNMIMLVFCGRPTETVLGAPGMAILYLFGAYAAAAAHYVVDPAAIEPMIGASGAISAVLGAYAILFGKNKVRVANPRVALWLNALWLMVAWVVLNLIVGMTFRQFSGGAMQVAVAAHIGGFAIGLLLANPLLLLRYRIA